MNLVVIEAPGKRAAYEKLFQPLVGGVVRVFATGGHFVSYPSSLWPLGCRLARDPATGEIFLDEHGRVARQDVSAQLRAFGRAVLEGEGKVYVATDADPEGEAIAFDVVVELAAAGVPIERCARLRPPSLDPLAFEAAVAEAAPMDWPTALRFAAPARARAFLDRWIASTFSKAGAPVGRILTAGIGLLVEHTPLGHSGRLTLRAPAADGGGDFWCMLEAPAIVAPKDPLAILARLFPDGRVPGRVARIQPVSAGVAPLIGYRKPFASAGLIVAMARRGLPPAATARAAQALYMDGLISYPRTSGAAIPAPGIAGLARLARTIGVEFDPGSPGLRAREARGAYVDDPGGCHAALHPVIGARDAGYRLSAMADVVADPFQPSALLRDMEQRVVFAEIARRALSAGLPSAFERGYLQVAPPTRTAQEAALVADLDWTRDLTPRPPWEMDFDLTPGLRLWSREARTAEALDQARLSRPATLASHAERMARSSILIPLKNSPFPVLGASPEARQLYEDAPAAMTQGRFAREVDALAARLFHEEMFLRLARTGAGDSAAAAAAALALALARTRDDVLALYERDGGDPAPLAAVLRLMEVAAPAPRAPDARDTLVDAGIEEDGAPIDQATADSGAEDEERRRRVLEEVGATLDDDDPRFDEDDAALPSPL